MHNHRLICLLNCVFVCASPLMMMMMMMFRARIFNSSLEAARAAHKSGNSHGNEYFLLTKARREGQYARISMTMDTARCTALMPCQQHTITPDHYIACRARACTWHFPKFTHLANASCTHARHPRRHGFALLHIYFRWTHTRRALAFNTHNRLRSSISAVCVCVCNNASFLARPAWPARSVTRARSIKASAQHTRARTSPENAFEANTQCASSPLLNRISFCYTTYI